MSSITSPRLRAELTREQGFLLFQQIWGCLECGSFRVWGWHAPIGPEIQPLLNCRCCQKPTRHDFVEVA